MCIRDRPGPGGRLARADPGPGADSDAGRRLLGRPGLPAACLLYTSDAADERSSVDLGGRRIIKNKKQLQTHSNDKH